MIYGAGQRFYDDLGISEGSSNRGDQSWACRFACRGSQRLLPPTATPTERRAALREVLAHADACPRVAKWEAERAANRHEMETTPGPGPNAVMIDAPGRYRAVYLPMETPAELPKEEPAA